MQGKVRVAGERHHHRGQSFIAGGYTEYAATRGQRANQAAEDASGIIAIGQRVEHAGGALRAAVARVGAVGREGDGAERFELLGGRVHQQADFPVPCVIPQCHGRAVSRADTAVGAENQEFLAAEFVRRPNPCRHFATIRRYRRKAARSASRA